MAIFLQTQYLLQWKHTNHISFTEERWTKLKVLIVSLKEMKVKGLTYSITIARNLNIQLKSVTGCMIYHQILISMKEEE